MNILKNNTIDSQLILYFYFCYCCWYVWNTNLCISI